MFIFTGLCILLILLCAIDMYEINDLTLLIPALKFTDTNVREYSRMIYLTIVFIEFVIGMPILEQRFMFIYLGNSIGDLKILGDSEKYGWISLERGSFINQGALMAFHYFLLYSPIIIKSFSGNTLQLLTINLIVGIKVIYIHRLRTEHGIISSIVAHMIFNFSLFLFLYTMYNSDWLHKGFILEQFTTTNNNCIDYIFGHNESVDNNL